MRADTTGVRQRTVVLGAALALAVAGCSGLGGDGEYFGRVDPPEGQHLRYVSGSETETLDPQYGTGQPDARIYAALFEGLIAYEPRTNAPLPGIAESWDANGDNTEFTFHLRPSQWSNGDPLTARDFEYSFRRAVSPELASRNSYMAYEIKYAQAYNESEVFARNRQTGEYLLDTDLLDGPSDEDATGDGALRVTLPGDAEARRAALEANPTLATLATDLEYVPVTAEDLGVEALDDLTLRVTLMRPAPYFIGVLAHQLFMPVHRATVEQYGNDGWAQVGRIVGNGPFVLDTWQPYSKMVVTRNPLYWDAANVGLDDITFYPIQEQTTQMNMYKAGAVDALQNHSVPASWIDVIRPLRDYMNEAENTVEYYSFNTLKPPMDDVRVRKAFNAAIDKAALAEFRRTAKPLTGFMPDGIFADYPKVEGDPFDVTHARELLAEAGYANAQGEYDPSAFPVGDIEILYNTVESNRQVAEFVQAQWKQNLGITVPLRNMEWRTFLEVRSRMEYDGFVRSGWIGDYLDPYTFLNLFQFEGGNNETGWVDPYYSDLLERANHELDAARRYEMLAEAERYLLDAQPIIPLMTQTTSWMKKPYVKGMYANPLTVFPWKYVYIEHDPAKWDQDEPAR